MNSLIVNRTKTLVFGPNKSKGVPEANYIETNPKKGSFAFFRWYSPTWTLFDQSWKNGQYH